MGPRSRKRPEAVLGEDAAWRSRSAEEGVAGGHVDEAATKRSASQTGRKPFWARTRHSDQGTRRQRWPEVTAKTQRRRAGCRGPAGTKAEDAAWRSRSAEEGVAGGHVDEAATKRSASQTGRKPFWARTRHSDQGTRRQRWPEVTAKTQRRRAGCRGPARTKKEDALESASSVRMVTCVPCERCDVQAPEGGGRTDPLRWRGAFLANCCAACRSAVAWSGLLMSPRGRRGGAPRRLHRGTAGGTKQPLSDGIGIGG